MASLCAGEERVPVAVDAVARGHRVVAAGTRHFGHRLLYTHIEFKHVDETDIRRAIRTGTRIPGSEY